MSTYIHFFQNAFVQLKLLVVWFICNLKIVQFVLDGKVIDFFASGTPIMKHSVPWIVHIKIATNLHLPTKQPTKNIGENFPVKVSLFCNGQFEAISMND